MYINDLTVHLTLLKLEERKQSEDRMSFVAYYINDAEWSVNRRGLLFVSKRPQILSGNL